MEARHKITTPRGALYRKEAIMPKKIEVVEMPDSLAFSEHTENVNKVANRQWRKWNNQARYIFNYIYGQMAYQKVIKHPGAKLIPEDHWNTVRWNAAWLAADGAWESVRGGAK